jgi:Mor family transcriptional regulator
MTPRSNADATNLPNEAVLAKLSIKMYDARKHDRNVTAHLNEEFKAAPDATRVHKHLFGGKVPELSAVGGAYKKLRDAHNHHTLPWDDDKVRLLPAANIMAHADAVREAMGEFKDAVRKLRAAYDRLRREAKDKLGKMYNPKDYPKDLENKYGVDLVFLPIPSGSHFRVGLPQSEIDKLAKSTEKHVQDTITASMQDAWKRLSEAVTYLRDRLDVEDSKNLRQTMVERLRDVAEILGRLNITHDAKLEEVRERVLKELAPINVDALKGNEKALTAVAAKADAILKAMSGTYKGKGGDA